MVMNAIQEIDKLIAFMEQDKLALKLCKDLLDPEMYGYSVSKEVRNAARKVLGIEGRE
jgi:hypothetical protein